MIPAPANEEPEQSIRHLDSLSLTRYDSITNDRSCWGIGFAVEVYSKSDHFWYPGQIINVSGKTQKRAQVLYNGSTKTLPITSGDLRPLITDAQKKSRKPFDERLEKARELLDKNYPRHEDTTLDAFISYSQQDGQDAAALLKLLLEKVGVNVWLDIHQDDISVTAMSRGISRSDVFLIFLTKSYFERVFTLFELESALELDKPIIVVYDADERHGGFHQFRTYIDVCPDIYKVELFQHEAIRFERRRPLQDTLVKVIAGRIRNHSNPCEAHSCSLQCNLL